MAQRGEICGIYEHRRNPDSLSHFVHQYRVQRTNTTKIKWESMETILGTNIPMKLHCTAEHIHEYHQYIMEYAAKTGNKTDNNKKPSKKRKKAINIDEKDIFIPQYDVESILDEKQDSGDDIQFLIRWRGWPQPYDCWIYQNNLDIDSLTLVDDFRRRRGSGKSINKNLGRKGFAANYWKELYAKEWKEYMDGMDNAIDHADYAFSFFKKFKIHQEIQHIADFGFGFGRMLDAFVKRFKPKIAYGLEPSLHAFNAYTNNFDSKIKANKGHFSKCHCHLECIDLVQYFKREKLTKEQVQMYNDKYKERKNKQKQKKPRNKKEIKYEEPNIRGFGAMDIDMDMNTMDKYNNVVTLTMDKEEMDDIMNDRNYKEFCYCSRGKSKNFYQRKHDKLNLKKLNRSNKATQKLELSVYDSFPCSCYARFDGSYQLGLCVSVLQYLNDRDVDIVLNELSKHCDFLYFDVVTAEEYDIMNSGSTFKDKWAISRPRKFYWDIIFKYWRMISNEILESKYFYPDDKSSNVPNTIYIINNLK